MDKVKNRRTCSYVKNKVDKLLHIKLQYEKIKKIQHIDYLCNKIKLDGFALFSTIL